MGLEPKDGQFSGEYICYAFAIWRPKNMSKKIKKLFSSFFMKKSLLVKQCCIFKVVLHINRKRIFFCMYWPNGTFQVCSKDELWLKKVIFHFHQWQKLHIIAVFLKVEYLCQMSSYKDESECNGKALKNAFDQWPKSSAPTLPTW